VTDPSPLFSSESSQAKDGAAFYSNMPPPPRFGGDAMRPALDYGDKRAFGMMMTRMSSQVGPKRVRLAPRAPLTHPRATNRHKLFPS
jgi:hypothetical protein